MIHVVNHTARTRGLPLDDDTRDDLVAEIFAAIVADQYAVLLATGKTRLILRASAISKELLARHVFERDRTPDHRAPVDDPFAGNAL